MQEVFPGPCESCDGMVVWDHLFMTAKCFCVDREVPMEWYNLAKWLFQFCQPWESSCPGIKASSAKGGGTKDTCLCSSGCPESAPAKLLTQHCPPKSECTRSQFHHITGYSLLNVVSWAVYHGGGSFSRHCCLWVRSASLPAGSQ